MVKVREIVGTVLFIELICFVALVSLFLPSSVTAGSVINPGVGVGTIRLNDNISKVFNNIGQRKADTAKRVDDEVWMTYEDMGLTLGFDKSQKLKRIIVTSRGLLMEKTGIHVGSKISDVEMNYCRNAKGTRSRPQREAGGSGNTQFWKCPEQGIIFTVNTVEERVEAITIIPK